MYAAGSRVVGAEEMSRDGEIRGQCGRGSGRGFDILWAFTKYGSSTVLSDWVF